MASTQIKICGIRDPETALFAAKSGADFVGMVFHPTSVRNIDITQAEEIAAAAKEGGAKPVAVFVNINADQILRICQIARVNIVQLHGNISRQQHHLLPPSFHRIYVQIVDEHGNIQNDTDNGLNYLNVERDYLLFDNVHAGSGKTFNWTNFVYKGTMPWFFSGGLTIENVADAIEKFHPTVVDVSSGVEKAPGEKDQYLIDQFIQKIKKMPFTHYCASGNDISE